MIPKYSPKDIASIWAEENKLKKWMDVEIAVVEARVQLGDIPKKVLEIIKKKAKFNVQEVEEIERVTHHDVIAFLTNVAKYVGAESRFIHQGMTSSDVLDTALSLQMKEAGNIILHDIDKLLNVLSTKAKKYKYTIQIGRTHGIHAEPITFGLKLALFFDEMKRNKERMKRAIETISVGKISGAVGTYEHLSPKVEAITCKLLGLKPDTISTQVIQRDRHAEYLNTLAVLMASIERFSVECRHLQRTEVLEVEEFFQKGQKGSSAMPHKRNPITFERLSGLARLVRANAFAGIENIALWHERDISHSSVERVIIPDSTIVVCYCLRKMTNSIDTLLVYPERMKENFNRSYGLVSSQTLMLALTQKGLLREDAYQVVQRNAMISWESKIHLKELVSKDKDIQKHLTEKELEVIFSETTMLAKIKKNVDFIFKRVKI